MKRWRLKMICNDRRQNGQTAEQKVTDFIQRHGLSDDELVVVHKSGTKGRISRVIFAYYSRYNRDLN